MNQPHLLAFFKEKLDEIHCTEFYTNTSFLSFFIYNSKEACWQAVLSKNALLMSQSLKKTHQSQLSRGNLSPLSWNSAAPRIRMSNSHSINQTTNQPVSQSVIKLTHQPVIEPMMRWPWQVRWSRSWGGGVSVRSLLDPCWAPAGSVVPVAEARKRNWCQCKGLVFTSAAALNKSICSQNKFKQNQDLINKSHFSMFLSFLSYQTYLDIHANCGWKLRFCVVETQLCYLECNVLHGGV